MINMVAVCTTQVPTAARRSARITLHLNLFNSRSMHTRQTRTLNTARESHGEN